MIDLFELEKHTMEWPTLNTAAVPKWIQKAAKKSAEDGTPTAFGHHPKHGWFVLCTAGQGPILVAIEYGQDW